MQRDVPVLGHCLGGQLMARALGAGVMASPAPEIGWHTLDVVDAAGALRWFGSSQPQSVFHWHYEAFELPVGAVQLATSAACPIQAFAAGRHLAMQFHVEMDAGKVEAWLRAPGPLYGAAQQRHATAQDADTIRRLTVANLPAQQALADCIYARWLAGSSPAFHHENS